MNRAFKTEFHNGEEDEKPIVTMSVRVNNGTRYRKLDQQGKDALYSNLEFFKHQLEVFMQKVNNMSTITTTNDKSLNK